MLTDRQLTPAERHLIEAAGTGEIANLGEGGELDDPARAGSWSAERSIRAEVIVELLTGQRTPPSGFLRAVNVYAARIDGQLDLRSLTVPCPLVFLKCAFDTQVELAEARTLAMRFYACRVPGIDARHLRADGSVSIRETVSTRAVSFDWAQVADDLVASDARLADPDGYALTASWLTAAGVGLDGLVADGGVAIGGSRVGRTVDLTGADLTAKKDGCALDAVAMSVDGYLTCRGGFVARGEVTLVDAEVRGGVNLEGAKLSNPGGVALQAGRMAVGRGLDCEDLVAEGTVAMSGTSVAGDLLLGGARLSGRGGNALAAGGLTVGRSLLGRDLVAEGGVLLAGASVERDVILSDARLRDEGGVALRAADLTVGRDLHVDGLGAVGKVILCYARIGGSLALAGAHLSSAADLALDAYLIDVEQNLFCTEGFVADGGVDLRDARIGGNVEFHGARLYGHRARAGADAPRFGVALDAYGLRAGRNVRCGNGFAARGEVNLANAVIGGSLWLDDAELHQPGGDALDADGLTVTCLFARDGFTAEGDLVLTAAHVTSEADLRGATLSSPGGYALAARALVVDGDLKCRKGFSADGRFFLRDAKVAGRVDLSDATLTDTAADHEVVLEGLRANSLDLCFAQPPTGVLDLTDAHVGSLIDRPDSWPEKLDLHGFRYDLSSTPDVPVKKRLAWIRRHDGPYAPGPYDELAAAYRRAGDVESARRVGISKEWHRRRRLNPIGKAWNWFMCVTVLYGYRSSLAAAWLLVLTVVGTAVCYGGQRVGSFRRASPDAPEFNAVLYAVDVLLPVGDLGQQAGWVAGGAAYVVSVLLTLGGWLLAAALVAGLTNALRRD